MTEGMGVLESASGSLTIDLCHHPAVYGGLGYLLPDLDLCAWKALDGLILHVVVVVVFALESASGGSFFVVGLLPPPQPLFLGAIRRSLR